MAQTWTMPEIKFFSNKWTEAKMMSRSKEWSTFSSRIPWGHLWPLKLRKHIQPHRVFSSHPLSMFCLKCTRYTWPHMFFLHVCISNQNWNTPIYKFRIISANLEPCTIPVLCWGEIRDYQEQLEKCLGISSYIQESLVSTSTFSRWPQIPEQVHQLETISSDFLGDTNSSSDSAWSLI